MQKELRQFQSVNSGKSQFDKHIQTIYGLN